MFLTGQKVVCVDADFHSGLLKFYTVLPQKDKVYVVRGMAPGVAPDNRTEELAVYLVGLVNPCSISPPYRERGFKAERFRPLDDLTETDILEAVEPTVNLVGQPGHAIA